MKLVLVNSTGPMASSVVSAIVDKFGYLNIPIRDIGIHDYLVGSDSVDMTTLKVNYSEKFKAFSEVVTTGGVSVLDRDLSKPRVLLDKNKISTQADILEKKEFLGVSELYNDYKEAFATSMVYKKNNHTNGKHVDLSVNFHKYDVGALTAAYQQEFGELVLIHLHREFGGWIESLISQRFVNPSLRKRFLFVFRWEYKRYMDYENKIKDCEGLHLDCDALFAPDITQIIGKISKELNEKWPNIEWKKEKYDLFGNLKSYNLTFTKADVEGTYISPITLKLIRYFYKKEKVTRFSDAVVYFFYLIDLMKFSIKKKFKSA